jgi:hypothetical protein
MKYRIIHDYGAYEGMKFYNDVEYDTVDEAVKAALAVNYGTPFLIVHVVEWSATPLADFNGEV